MGQQRRIRGGHVADVGRPDADREVTETLIALESMTCNVAHQSNDAREGVQAFLQKRDPVWTDS